MVTNAQRHDVFIWNRCGVRDKEVHWCHTIQNRRTGFLAVPKESFLSTFITLNLTVLDGLALSSSDDVTLLPGESTGAVRKHLLVAILKRWHVVLKCKKFLLGTIVRYIFVEMAIPLLIFLEMLKKHFLSTHLPSKAPLVVENPRPAFFQLRCTVLRSSFSLLGFIEDVLEHFFGLIDCYCSLRSGPRDFL